MACVVCVVHEWLCAWHVVPWQAEFNAKRAIKAMQNLMGERAVGGAGAMEGGTGGCNKWLSALGSGQAGGGAAAPEVGTTGAGGGNRWLSALKLGCSSHLAERAAAGFDAAQLPPDSLDAHMHMPEYVPAAC